MYENLFMIFGTPYLTDFPFFGPCEKYYLLLGKLNPQTCIFKPESLYTY